MSWIVLVAGMLLVAGVIVARSTRAGPNAPDSSRYRRTDALLTPPERAFHAALGQVAGRAVTVLVKVRMADVVAPARGLTRRARARAIRLLAGDHFDFLLCRQHDLSAICAIEIDAGAPPSPGQRRRRALLDGVCASVGVPLLRVAAKSRYGGDELARLLAPYLDSVTGREADQPQPPPGDEPDDKLCPNCRSFMIVRVAVDRNRAGGEYWACNGYPKCGYVEAINA